MKEKMLTPLGIIALFISLSEAVAGIVATQTEGHIQLILTLFVVFFPIHISILFFCVLWHRPIVFYHPKEFEGQTTVEAFSEAMERRFRRVDRWVEKTEKSIRNVVNDEEKAESLVNEIVKSHSLTLNTKPILGNLGQIIEIPYDEFESIGLFLRYVWHRVDNLPVHSYGKEWILSNAENGQRYYQIGSRFARKHLGTKWDERTLEEVGIKPGMTIQVERLRSHRHFHS